MIPVKGHKGLFRDEKSGAIINTDVSEYNNYMVMKNKKQSEKDELDRIKSDIQEIKNLLKQLVNPT
tara:strand:+ start:10773 stop:10970 length:198 start_codon:yes stop_codon:yes gene_type:complete